MAKAIRRGFERLSILCGAVVMVGLLLPVTGAVAQEPYRLSVSDRILVRVVEWKASEALFEEWTALGGEYLVGPTGTTSFPFVGETESAGKTTSELAEMVSQGLKQSLGLITPPNVSIQVAQFGPIYVTGDVQSPGEYLFSPGLNVIKALSLAGGERRTSDANSRAERELISANGEYKILQEEYLRLLARRARLDAELAGADEITVPEDLAESEDVEALIAAEQAILEAHSRQLTSQTSALQDQVALLNREIETFAQKREALERQLSLAEEQLANVRNLAEGGLTLVSRVSSLETNVADLQGRLLDIDTATLQARQDIGDADREQAQLTDVRVSELTLERQEVDGQIVELAMKLATQEGLIREAVAYSGIATAEEDAVASYTYTIVRGGEEIEADTTTEVSAGDVIIARLEVAQ
ncbi:polysaccharide biosynthesis/export family protein [Devosia nitrariae]|uniref:Sugar ABC transporter substrate-binding protein n=1 Tax=Devosia nitrariae TaxID=2071872 RepID=A0ABQ5WE27_9HYPH|nr:polysaccharide biosynthesis/export family protein [Devosia nitrariae]GLQ58087.1 sugar ABC transporter substrate-binding protein [Devosia nitrariae]